MELDKRIKEGKRPLTCFDTEQAKEFLGKECYFTNAYCTFEDLHRIPKSELQYISNDKDASDPYKTACYFYPFCLPCEWVEEEKKEPKYRPYTIKDFEKAFLNGEFEDFIIFRDKNNPEDVYTMRYNGNFRKGEFEYICLGAKNFSFESLFENYEVANYDGDFVPFGVVEDD